MADAFDAASRSVEDQRRALLAAVAAGGTAGRQAYEQSRAEIGQLRGSAIQAALAQAGGRGAPQGVLDEISGQVGQGYDRQLSGMAASQGSRDATFAQQGASGNVYMDQAQAGIPALRFRAQRQKEQLEAEAFEKAEERAMKLAQGDQDLEIGRMQLKKAEQGDDNPLELAKLGMAQEKQDWERQARDEEINGPGRDAYRKSVHGQVQEMGKRQPKILTEFDFAVNRNTNLEGALAHVRNLRTDGRRVFKKDGSYGVLEGLLRDFYARG